MSILTYSAAQRLLSVFEFLTRNKSGKFADLASCLGVSSDIPSVMSEVGLLYVQMDAISRDIEAFSDSPSQQGIGNLFQNDLMGIRKSLQSLSLNPKNSSYGSEIDPTSLVALRYIEAALPKEQLKSEDEIAEIRTKIAEIQSDVETSRELPKVLREWLLDLVRMMRDGIDRYCIRGTRGLREQLRSIVGELCLSQGVSKEVKQTKPEIWTVISTVMTAFIKMADLTEKYGPAIETVLQTTPILIESCGGR